MSSENVAYTEEYLEHRAKYSYIFEARFLLETEVKILSDGKHKLFVSHFLDESKERTPYNMLCSRSLLMSGQDEIAVIECIGYDAKLLSMMEHSNGKTYLFYDIDLYGYCLMDLTSYQSWQYVPKKSFLGKGETFIWVNAIYCKANSLLAVDGCFWGSPYGTCLFDCSDPEKLPYNQLYSFYKEGIEISLESPIRWNDDGTLVVGCEGMEKVVDVSVRRNGKIIPTYIN